MLRTRLNDALKEAMRAKNQGTVSALRMILAALKDRDIAARPQGVADGIGDTEILSMLQSMIKQRNESITLYEQGNRPDLVEKERAEIAVIESFLPKQMSEAETQEAIRAVIAAVGASSIKDMGKVMAELKTRHTGTMDFSKAGPAVKQHLSGG